MNIRTRTIVAGGVAAGILIGAWVTLTTADPASDTPRVVAEPAAAVATTDGIRSVDEVVEFWRGRVDAAPGGYIDETQLGVALAAQARASADVELYEESESVLRDALEANPEYVPARLALARALHAQHDFGDALSLAAEVAAADPTSLDAIALAGDAHLELGDVEAAAGRYGELAAIERSAPVVSRLAKLAWVQGDPDRAVELAEEALATSATIPLRAHDRAYYRFLVGHFRFEAGDVDGAIASLEAALVDDPTHPGSRERLAFVYASDGRNADAEQLYRSLLTDGGAADLHGSYAELLAARGADDEAAEHERIAAELAAATVDEVPAERRHVASYYTTRDPEVAVALAQADLAGRGDVGAYSTLAWALHHAGRHAEADRVMADALAVGTRSAELSYRAGAIAHAVGDLDRARGHLTDALALNDRFHPTDAARAASLLAG